MKQKPLSLWLKVIIAGIAICAILIYAVVVPMAGQTIAAYENGEFDYCYIPWLTFISLTSIPLAAGLVLLWKIAGNIGADRSFCTENAKLLKWISFLAAADGAYFFAGNTVFLFLNMNHPGIVLLSLAVVFVCAVISVAAAAASHLAAKAAELQEQSDLTI